MTKPVILIPARMESARFPGKPLAPILHIPLVIRCANNAISSGLDTYVCTDSQLILDACKSFSIPSIKTPEFSTGTDRVHWSSQQLNFDLIINLQGDEPLIKPQAIKTFSDQLEHSNQQDNFISNGLTSLDQTHAFDPNNVKAIQDNNSRIIYLSRKPLRNSNDSNKFPIYLKQLGLYGFTKASLNKFSNLNQSRLELTESIEMLRWIEEGMNLNGNILDTPSISVDTPEDLAEVESILRNYV